MAIGKSPEVAQFLLQRGAKADAFLAAALGDVPLAERLVNEDRGCLAHGIRDQRKRFLQVAYFKSTSKGFRW